MAEFDYAEIQVIAQQLIADFGGQFTFVSFDSTVADSAKPWDGPADPRAGAATSSVQTGVLVEPSSAVRLGIATEISDLIKRSDKILIVPGVDGIDLTTFEEVESSDGPFKITMVHKLAPNGSTTLLWFVGLKR